MNIVVQKLDEYKIIIGFVIVVCGGAFSVWSWAADTKEEILEAQQMELVLVEAKAAIVHNDFYQEGRIARKEDQIKENQRELNYLLEYLGDDEPTLRQSREIEYLDEEIARLRQDIENIRVKLETE